MGRFTSLVMDRLTSPDLPGSECEQSIVKITSLACSLFCPYFVYD